MSLKRRVQLFITFLLILTSTIFTAYYIHHEKEHNIEHVKKSSQNIKNTLNLILEDLNHFYTYRAYANLRSQGVMEAIRAHDTRKLYDLTLPRYKTLREENSNLMIMQFHAPDGTSILRMHRPEVFGDEIAKRRPLIHRTHQTHAIHTGFEGGIEGIAYRIVVPFFEKNAYIGALEFGVDTDYIIGKLIHTTKMDTLFMLHESKMAAADIQKYPTVYNGYHFSHISPYQQPLIDEFVKNNPELNERIIQYKGKEYDVIHTHLSSSDGKPIGMLLCFNDMTTGYDEFVQIILESVMITLLLIIILLAIIEYIFSRMTKQIMYQEKYISTILNSQKNIIVVTDGNELIYVNNAFFDYFPYHSLKDFKKDHGCICYLFETGEGENYLQPEMEGMSWTDYIVAHKEREHKAKITVDGKSSIFSVNAQMMEYENVLRCVVTFNDITDLNKLATLDRLTKIANRFEFDKMLGHSISLSRRYQRPLSILLVDIDHFKLINDRFGHLIGDEVLKVFSSLLSKQIRDSDVVARWGGEEFVILLPDTSLASAIKMAEALRQRIEVHTFETVQNLTCSIGVAEFNPVEEADDLLHRADEKLYAAKNGGRNRIMA
ncbi:MAG TPA: diguanylate cyclase [Sulfuricurvum sp.]|nr:diguanylate cyclase [Sulfuricurvum sp.]